MKKIIPFLLAGCLLASLAACGPTGQPSEVSDSSPVSSSDVVSAQELESSSEVESSYPDCDVEVHYGGQPIYYYVASVE